MRSLFLALFMFPLNAMEDNINIHSESYIVNIDAHKCDEKREENWLTPQQKVRIAIITSISGLAATLIAAIVTLVVEFANCDCKE